MSEQSNTSRRLSDASNRSNVVDRAKVKAYLRLLPVLFLCYIIAYVDRTNVAVAKLTMGKDLPGFDSWVFGFGGGIFFIGYFLLEIPDRSSSRSGVLESGSVGSW